MSRTFRRLHVALVGSQPEIWRDFSIADDLTLLDLHRALQIIVGWRESHLHIFSDADPYARSAHEPRKDEPRTAEPRRWGPQFPGDQLDLLPEDTATIAEAFAGTGSLWYEYDLGDGWIHRIDMLGASELAPSTPPVGDVDGANRAPYEDAGGMHGYLEKLEIVADPAHPEHRFLSDWVRQTVGPWAPRDPAFFDPLGVQSELNQLFHPDGAGGHPYDMSGIVKDDAHRGPDDVQLESPIADLLGALPVPLRSELRQHLHRGDLLEPTNLSDDDARRVIAPYIWLLEAVGSEGITLTQAGWLPPRVVLDAMTTLGWSESWIGKGNREDITVPVALLRESAQHMGLVRVQKGRLLLGADAKLALGEPRRVLRLVASRIYRGLKDYERYTTILLFLAVADRIPRERRWEVGAFGLDALGWQSGDRSGTFTGPELHEIGVRAEDVVTVLTWNERLRSLRSVDRRDVHGDDLVLFAREVLR